MIEHRAGDTVEEIYLTVKELAELKGCTERYIQSQIRKGQIAAEQATGSVIGRGGIQYRIPLSGLERGIQTKFKRRLRAVENALQPEQMIEEVDAESLTQEEREEIIFWKRTLEDWQRYRDCAFSKEQADEAYIEMFAVQHPEIRLTRRTLYRKWRDWQKKGEAALADRRGKHESHQRKLDGEIYDVFEYYYLDQSRKSVTLCMTLTELNFRQLGREDLLPLPSKTTFERAVRSIPIPYVKYFRYGEKQFIGECAPYIRRMYEDLESNDIWVADNHTFDIMVAKDGSPVRVYLTAFMDVRSRKMMGWCVTDAPSSDATIYALKKGCEEYGVPKALYTDNGREFLFHDLGGNGFRRKRKNDELKLPSILDDLGIAFRTALPRNARAKGIERAFYTVKETFSKLYESYTGGTILEKPDQLKEVVKHPDELTAVEEFQKQVDTYIRGFYNKHPHRGTGMNGKCPDEVFAANLIEKRMIQKDKLNLMFMRYAKGSKGTLRVGKNGVSLKFYGQELQYWNEDLWRLHYGQDVYVRYSPDDLSSVRVYNADKQLICTAKLRTALSYQATKEDIRAATAENRRAVKTIRAYKQQKEIAAEDELKLILDTAAENMSDFALNPKVIRPIYSADGTELRKAVGAYEEPIDWAAGIERLRKAKEEIK